MPQEYPLIDHHRPALGTNPAIREPRVTAANIQIAIASVHSERGRKRTNSRAVPCSLTAFPSFVLQTKLPFPRRDRPIDSELARVLRLAIQLDHS